MSVVAYSDSQRTQALASANHRRIGRAELRTLIRQGDIQIAQVLEDPPISVSSMLIYQLLLLVPKVGLVRVSAVLKRTEIWPLRPVEKLTGKQRARLIRELAR